ncbi:DUF421 domain-containing protein [Yokenella regensburgei]|uniref:DUF421 domain-containing protein n=1 Tax=Yokenella regensburgei TaxID=158877 RepID=UPI003ED93D08
MEYYGYTLVKFIIGFVIVITHLNLSGKTQLSQMTPVDFIGNFVLGGIIGGVIYSDSIPMHQYVVVLFIGVFLISLLNALSKRIHFFRAVTIGQPIPIIKEGRFLIDAISSKGNKIDILNVSSQLHAQGIPSFQEVNYAQIEPSGEITVVCDGAKMPSVIVMKDGKARIAELSSIEKDEAWLACQLKSAGIDPHEVFLAEFWNGKVSFILNNGEVKFSL